MPKHMLTCRSPRLVAVSAAVLLALVSGGPVLAQDQGAHVDEIVVTAQKREQRWIDVPINLSAFSGDFLQDLGYYDYAQIGTLVPGLTVQAQSPNNPGYNCGAFGCAYSAYVQDNCFAGQAVNYCWL